MKYAWILYSKQILNNSYGNNAFDWMREAAADYGIELEVLMVEDLSLLLDGEAKFNLNSKELRMPDFAIMRSYNFTIAHQLEKLGIRVINRAYSMELSKNKVLTHQLLAKSGIPSPKTIYGFKNDYAELKTMLGTSFVLKKIDGSRGEGVYLVKSEDEFSKAYSAVNGEYLAQEFIGASSGEDVRVYVLGGEVIGAIHRKSNSDFRSNYSLGGKCDVCQLSARGKELAVMAAEALDLEFAGVDLLFSGKDGEFTVCEVNANPGFRTLSAVTDIDLPRLLFAYACLPSKKRAFAREQK